MNQDLTKLLAILDSVIEAGENKTGEKTWENNDLSSDIVYRNPSTNGAARGILCGFSEDAHFIALSCNLSPLMAETLKSHLECLVAIINYETCNGIAQSVASRWATEEMEKTITKWKHLL